MHWAAHGHTAAEIVFSRADASKPMVAHLFFPLLSQLPKSKFMEMLEEDAKAAGLAEGIAKGKLASKLEYARKLVEHGVSWEIITSASGIKPGDILRA